MKRLGIIALAVLLGGFAYLQFKPQESSISVTQARATPVGTSDELFMVTLDMQNDGAAVALTGVSSPSGADVSVMNPSQTGPLTIPQKGKGLLAMDGAHIMHSVPPGDFEEGSFQSVSLLFDDGTKRAVRVMRHTLNGDMGGMQHGAAHGIQVDPSPRLTLLPPETVSADGFDVAVHVENFDFILANDDAAHVANEGHGHIYLNGLKLGRLYKESFSIGGLVPGAYTLTVALNTNDHRPYVSNGEPITADFGFNIP